MTKLKPLIKSPRRHFNFKSIKTKALTLSIEHLPCCLMSVAAGMVGLPWLDHNPAIELGFAVGGAIGGEYLGGKIFNKGHVHKTDWYSLTKRYGLALAFGVCSWGIHQKLFHKDHDHGHDRSPKHNHDHEHRHDRHDGHTKNFPPAKNVVYFNQYKMTV